MTFYKPFDNPRLYIADTGTGQLLLVLPADCSDQFVKTPTAWESETLKGTFVYTASNTGVTQANAPDFVNAVLAWVRDSGSPRAFIWLTEPTAWQTRPLDAHTAPRMPMNDAATVATGGLVAPILPEAKLVVAAQAGLAYVLHPDGASTVTVTGAVSFDGAFAPVASPAAGSAVLALDGAAMGTLAFSIQLERQSLLEKCLWGFQFRYPSADPAVPAGQWLPLATAQPGGTIGFQVVMDPSDPANGSGGVPGGASHEVRSRLTFSGSDGGGALTVLDSWYRTRQGTAVKLIPVSGAGNANSGALVFDAGAPGPDGVPRLHLAPVEDFTLAVAGDAKTAELLCGLQGTEVITFHPDRTDSRGDWIRFTPYQAAYAPAYPFVQASPVAAPIDASAPLLDRTYTTSWATVVEPGPSTHVIGYVAQPKGGALYGVDDPGWSASTGLMTWKTPTDVVRADASFPLVPYAGLASGSGSSASTAADFEREIVSPTRRSLVSAPGGTQGTQNGYTVVTSSGLLAGIAADGHWSRILLGQTLDPQLVMCFDNPVDELRRVFQDGQVLLVAADGGKLGNPYRGDGNYPGDKPFFANTLEIGGWELTARVGRNNRYGDYRNVLIVKGRKGRLYDPASRATSLVANPQRWTQHEVFSAPTDLVANPAPPPGEITGSPNPRELVVFSRWLQDYFAAAERSGDPDLDRFNEIAADENWTGVLVLRMDVTKVPDDLLGIMAGIADPGAFCAHHLGIEISPVTLGDAGKTPQVLGASSMFGLIDYQDPAFRPPAPGEAVRPVRPASGTEYEFRMLALKVAFANTAVRSFSSYAQLTTTTWFDMTVEKMGEGGNPYGAIVLEGSLQSNGGLPVYSMAGTADSVFHFANDSVARLEITDAVMSTRNSGSAHDTATGAVEEISSWFALTGFLDFKALRGDGYDFDVFSFGADPAAPEQTRTGLAFANLGILMTYPKDDPLASRLSFDPGEIRFDVSTSTPRAGSLFRQFALEVSGLVSGTEASPPSRSGYATALTAAQLTGVEGEPWWGIDYRLPLGTPGNLAGRTGLTAHLVTAWSPARSRARGGTRAMVGLRLPGADGGARLISLQNVLKLSVGQIWLQYDQDQDAFLLLFTEIALKLFGLLSLPPGSTLFYLYGDPGPQAGTTIGGVPSGLGWYAMYRQNGSGS